MAWGYMRAQGGAGAKVYKIADYVASTSTVDVKTKTPNWGALTNANFIIAIRNGQTDNFGEYGTVVYGRCFPITPSYNAQTGVLAFSGQRTCMVRASDGYYPMYTGSTMVDVYLVEGEIEDVSG